MGTIEFSNVLLIKTIHQHMKWTQARVHVKPVQLHSLLLLATSHHLLRKEMDKNIQWLIHGWCKMIISLLLSFIV